MNYNWLKWLLLLFSIGYSLIGFAQKKELKILHAMQYKIYLDEDPNKVKKLLFKIKNAEIGIKGTDKNHISITAIKGWKQGENFKYEFHRIAKIDKADLTLLQDENKIDLGQNSEEQMVYWLEIPKTMSVLVVDKSMFLNKVTVANIDTDVAVNTVLSPIDIQNIDGRVLANSQAGDIVVSYDRKVNKSSITSAGRKVTLKLLKDAKANLQLNVVTGAIITDFDLGEDIKKKDLKGRANMRTLNGKINGGGTKIYVMAHTIELKKIKK